MFSTTYADLSSAMGPIVITILSVTALFGGAALAALLVC
jgi:hypothetical protein